MTGCRCGVMIGLVVGVLSFALAGSAPLPAQQPDRPGLPAPAGDPAAPPLEGFWPTQRLTEYAIRRWCGQLTYEYELDDEQSDKLQRMMLRRWPRWLKESRPELQPLLNEFIENRLAPEPPSSERISDWAGRALHMFDLGRQELHAAQAEFRQLLTPVQKMKFDADAARMNLGMEVFEQKLRGWHEGRYARHELWDRPYWDRRHDVQQASEQPRGQRHAEPDSARAAQEAEPEVLPLDTWESYVVAFIRKYALDPEQVTSAWTIMGDLRARADRHKQRHRTEYARIEDQLAHADGEARQALLARREQLDEALARLFEELKDRLNRLLTEAQRDTRDGLPEAATGQASSSS